MAIDGPGGIATKKVSINGMIGLVPRIAMGATFYENTVTGDCLYWRKLSSLREARNVYNPVLNENPADEKQI